MKNSFVLYTDYLQQIELLNNEQRGVLLTAVMKYASGLEMPEMDGITMMAFSFIKSNMDKDNEKYERTVKARQEAGKSGGRPKANDFSEKQTKAKKANGFFEKQNNPDNDNENDNVNDNVNDLSVGCKQPMCGKAPRNEAEYPYKAICDRLNTLSGTAFKDKSKDTRKHIKARFEEGFTLEDFYTVIDKKVAEWRGTDMEKYLRPSTLFGSKFESYLNQCDKPSRETVKGQREYYESDWTELL